MQEAGPWPGMIQRALGRGTRNATKVQVGGQGNPGVGSFPPEPIPLPPQAPLACSLGGQTAS